MKFISVLFFVVGLGLLTGAGFLWLHKANFAAHAVHGDGVVVDLHYRSGSNGDSGTYVPEVEFTASNGSVVHITGSTGSNPAAYTRGEKVNLLYAPENPEGAHIDSFSENWLGVLILGGMGLIFGLIGGGMIYSGLRTRQVNKWLATNGLRVQAKLENVLYDTSLKVNGRSPWRLICQWQHPVTQKVYLFKSANIWFDPTSFVKRETLDVLVDMDNPRRYHVDTSFLPQMG
ncbi:MAG: DUF3592 domain-containing protein [Proteobacteria bacterium]|nr:DUF3592 domain-containing protein [Pseudomonadota bacterium]